MKKILLTSTILISFLFTGQSLFSWEIYDQVLAVVNSIAIAESEINIKLSQMNKIKRIPQNKILYEKSRILDKFIEDALVFETANDESIVISDGRVIGHLEKILLQYLSMKYKDEKKIQTFKKNMLKRLEKRIRNENLAYNNKFDPHVDNFIKFIEKKQKLSFSDFFEELRNQMRKEQVMSIAIGISPPKKKEALKWYANNKKKLGDEVWIKRILIKPKNWTLIGEKNANKKITDIKNKIAAGASFERLARIYSHDRATAVKGGDMGWVMLAEVAEKDPYFAGFVNTLKGRRQVSQIFKTSKGYHLVKLMGKRPVSFEKVEQFIMYKIYTENLQKQFQQWVDKRKRESEIQILMKKYIKAKV